MHNERLPLLDLTWHGDRLHSICVGNKEWCHFYDVDWCNRDQCYYYHLSGCGPWGRDLEPSLNALPMGMQTAGDLIRHFDMVHRQVVFCQICDDTLPDDSPCPHVWWDEGIGDFAGPGII